MPAVERAGQLETEAQAWEENPDGSMTVNKFVEEVQNILYAKDHSTKRSEAIKFTRLNPRLNFLGG